LAIFAAGGTIIVGGHPTDVLEGEWHGNQTARSWYNSAEYQAVAGLRHAAAESNAVIIGGFEMPVS